MCKMLPILLLFCLFKTTYGLWIVAQIKEINWQQNCIQDKNCELMDLSLLLDSNSAEGLTQSTWRLENVLKNPQNSKIFVYWTMETQLTNITLKSLLTANDILFNIQRPCDHTSPINVFSPMIKTSAYNAPQNWNSLQNDAEKRQIGLVGKCYHLIIEVSLYTQNCPWCVQSIDVKQSDLNASFIKSFDQLLESPTVAAFVLFILFLILIGIVLCVLTLHKSKKLNDIYQQQYVSSSLTDLPFNRNQMNSMISNIPLPPISRPPFPDDPLRMHQINVGKIHEASICPYYETLDTHTLQNATKHKNSSENYDSAFDQSLGGSPNSSFSGQNLSSDSGRCSPQQIRARAEYV